MNASIIALLMLAVVFGGALVGLWLQKVLPEHHLAPETKDVVRLVTALIATISALVLSLLISSAKSSFDRFDDELTQNAARVVMLDRTLAEYGPQSHDIRALLKAGYAKRIEHLFVKKDSAVTPLAIIQEKNIDTSIFALAPVGLVQEGLKARAIELNGEINATTGLIHAQRYDSLPTNLLMVLGVWLTLIFTTFGLFAPRNAVTLGVLLMCSMSASGAVFLLLEMNSPFTGLLTLSSAPMDEALRLLGQ